MKGGSEGVLRVLWKIGGASNPDWDGDGQGPLLEGAEARGQP